MATIEEILHFCQQRLDLDNIKDFDGAYNGLQVQGKQDIKKIGASVDAGIMPFEQAVASNVDFLIVHHGLFWTPPIPVTGAHHKKLKILLDNDINLYGAHLPLDAHPEIGNNAVLAKKLGLKAVDRFLDFEGTPIGLITNSPYSRGELSTKLREIFPNSYIGIEYGSDTPQSIAFCSGSGAHALEEIAKLNIDTLITGELRQHHYNFAQENNINVYPCGHYATETFGVDALGKELAGHFNLEYEFIPTDCPL